MTLVRFVSPSGNVMLEERVEKDTTETVLKEAVANRLVKPTFLCAWERARLFDVDTWKPLPAEFVVGEDAVKIGLFWTSDLQVATTGVLGVFARLVYYSGSAFIYMPAFRDMPTAMDVYTNLRYLDLPRRATDEVPAFYKELPEAVQINPETVVCMLTQQLLRTSLDWNPHCKSHDDLVGSSLMLSFLTCEQHAAIAKCLKRHSAAAKLWFTGMLRQLGQLSVVCANVRRAVEVLAAWTPRVEKVVSDLWPAAVDALHAKCAAKMSAKAEEAAEDKVEEE